jgi:hypothetical protein
MALQSSIRVTRIVISHPGMNDRLCKSAASIPDSRQSASLPSRSEVRQIENKNFPIRLGVDAASDSGKPFGEKGHQNCTNQVRAQPKQGFAFLGLRVCSRGGERGRSTNQYAEDYVDTKELRWNQRQER